MNRIIPVLLALSFAGCSLVPVRCADASSTIRQQARIAERRRAMAPEQSSESDGWIVNDYAAALAEAKETGTPIFVDFSGYTCTNCRWTEKNIFTDPRGKELLYRYVCVRLYTDRREESNKRNRQMQIDRFRTIDLPLYAIISPDDAIVSQTVFTRDTNAFLSFLEEGLAE